MLAVQRERPNCISVEHDRQEFHPAGAIPYSKISPDAEDLIGFRWPPALRHSAVSLHRLKNVRMWIDNRAICVYSADNEIIDDVSLLEKDFDISVVSETKLKPLPGTTVMVPHFAPQNYYHWLIDMLPFAGVLEMANIPINSIDNFYIHRLESGFQKTHLNELGIDVENVHGYKTSAKLRGARKHYALDELIVPMFRLDGGPWPSPWCVDYLQQAYRTTEPQPSKVQRKIYVARGDCRRGVTNEAELIKYLIADGYDIVRPDELSLREQAKAFANADFVLGPHGAGLVNTVFCKPNTKVLEFGGYYITQHFRIVATLTGLNYDAIAAGIGHNGKPLGISQTSEDRLKSFKVDIEKVLTRARAFARSA